LTSPKRAMLHRKLPAKAYTMCPAEELCNGLPILL
jgi:hypothetical protein